MKIIKSIEWVRHKSEDIAYGSVGSEIIARVNKIPYFSHFTAYVKFHESFTFIKDRFKTVDQGIEYINKFWENHIGKFLEVDYLAICESCQVEFVEDENTPTDDDGNKFCPSCYEVLAPVMKSEYEELKRNGELD